MCTIITSAAGVVANYCDELCHYLYLSATIYPDLEIAVSSQKLIWVYFAFKNEQFLSTTQYSVVFLHFGRSIVPRQGKYQTFDPSVDNTG